MKPPQDSVESGLPATVEARERSHNAIYLLRTTQQHHVQLSAMADQKASIIIGAAFVLLAMVFGKASSGMEIPHALVMLATTLMLSGLLAALAVMPRFGKAPKSGSNPLFFGHFTALPEDEYVKNLVDILESDETIYETMSRDIYQLGRVLRFRKYRYLGWSYRALVVGGLLSAAVFVAETYGVI
jgi:hypothetical protein